MVKYVKLLPLLIALALLAGAPAAVSGQEPVTVRLSDATYTATEGTDSDVDITVEMSSTYSSDVQVELSGVDDDCSDGAQLKIDDSTITISAGDTSETVSIDICDDSAVEYVVRVTIGLLRLATTPSDVVVDTSASEIRLSDDPTTGRRWGSRCPTSNFRRMRRMPRSASK